MKPLPRVQHSPELLDDDQHAPAELEQSLGHVAGVNRWLGGAPALLKHLTPLLRPDRTTRILDVGTGSADSPRLIADWARKHRRSVRIHATDAHPQMLTIAAAQCAAYPEITVEAADALNLPYGNDEFDIALLTLTLHHFEDGDQLRVVRELARVAGEAVIVNDLLRSRLNYLGAKLLSVTLWRGNRLTRHDAPLSVLRAFTPGELHALAMRAGLNARVHRHFFQRVVLVMDSAKAAAR